MSLSDRFKSSKLVDFVRRSFTSEIANITSALPSMVQRVIMDKSVKKGSDIRREIEAWLVLLRWVGGVEFE